VYAILYSDPAFLGAAVQQNGSATLTLTIPATTDPGTHRLTFSSYDEGNEGGFVNDYREYLDVQVLAAPGAKLAATGANPALPLALGVFALIAGIVAIGLRRRLA
jgi:hypothetical protein